MAVKNVIVLLSQSNGEVIGTDRTVLPAGLRGPQASVEIWNEENSAIETLDVDGVGANLPNNTTSHTSPWFGWEMKLSENYVTELGSVLIFKYAVSDTVMGPSSAKSSWNTEDNDLFANFKTRFANMVAAMGVDTPNVVDIFWLQGESDAGIEGHELAYYGLYRRFIKEVRSFLAPYTSEVVIPWTAGLIDTSVGNQSTDRVNTIRSAIMRAGWDDPFYRVFDLRGLSFQTDGVHLDSQGAIDAGQAAYDAKSLTYNNTMALVDYTLKGLRDRAMDEFGIDKTDTNKAIANQKINDAIQWVVHRRKNWPWMRRKLVIDVGLASAVVDPIRIGAGVFTLGQSVVEGLDKFSYSPSGFPSARQFITLEEGATGTQGVLVASTSSDQMSLEKRFIGDAQVTVGGFSTGGSPTVITITNMVSTQGGTIKIPDTVTTFPVKLAGWVTAPTPGLIPDAIYVATRVSPTQFSIAVDTTGEVGTGAIQVGKEFTLLEGLFRLPQDFMRMYSVYLGEEVDDNKVDYLTRRKFEEELRNRRVTATLDEIYTVVPDLLDADDEKRLYLWIFPYLKGRDVLYVTYYGDARKLVADGDVPDVPRNDNLVVLFAVNWFIAQWQKDEMASFYRDQALLVVEDMENHYDLSDEDTLERASDAAVGDFIRGPAEFPEFHE